MSDDPMPRRVRPQDGSGAAPPEKREPAQPSDELMSQFDAIERMLRARREAEQDQETPPTQDRAAPAKERAASTQESAATEQASAPKSPAAKPRPLFPAPKRQTPPAAQQASPPKPSSAEARPPATTPKRPPPPPPPPAAPRKIDRTQAADAETPPTRGRGRVLLIAGGAAAAALAIVATVIAVKPNSTTAAPPPTSNGGTQPANGATQHPLVRPSPTPDEVQAAQWIADHVGPDHVVACDVDLCALVSQFGASAASLVTAGSDITEVERADVVISTSLMRTDFGAQLTQLTSPEPLASFGTGADQVVVAAVAIDGSTDYGHRLTVDRDDRRRIGAALAHSPRITFATPNDTADLRNGLVDSRLSSLLTLIGSTHTLTVTSFGGTGPGAGGDIPESEAVITRVDGRPVGGSTPQSAALIALVDAQRAPYRPLSVVGEADGVKISFSQPEPLGLLAGATP